MASGYVPARGDIVWLELDPRIGHEQAGRRPAIIVSPQAYNRKVGLALVCPITSRVKGYPFEVLLPPEADIQGVVLSDQVKSVDWRARKAKRIESVPESVMLEVCARLLPLVQPES